MIIGQIAGDGTARIRVVGRLLRHRHTDSEADAAHNLIPRRFRVENPAHVHNDSPVEQADDAQLLVHAQTTELRPEGLKVYLSMSLSCSESGVTVAHGARCDCFRP